MSQPDHPPRALSSSWKLALRILFLLALIACLFFLYVGITPYFKSYTNGYIGVHLPENEAGEVTVEVLPGYDAEAAGLASGDILLAINGGSPLGTEEERYAQLSGHVGEAVTLTVRKPDGSEQTLPVTRSSIYYNNIIAAGLTPVTVGGTFVVLSLAAGLGFAILAALLLREGQGWLAALAGFSLLFFPYSLNVAYSAYYGAMDTNMVWFYNLLRAAGLFLVCLLLFVFPTGKFNPRWTRWVVYLIAAWMLPYLAALWIPGFLPGTLLDLVWMAFLALAILFQIFRHQRINSPEEKKISRPVVVGALIALVVYLLNYIGSIFDVAGSLPQGVLWWYILTAELVLNAALLAFGFGLVRSMRRIRVQK